MAIAARKVEGLDTMSLLLAVLGQCGEDRVIPGIVWQNLHPLLEDRAEALALQYSVRHEATKLMDLIALTTSLAMDFVYTGRLTG